MVVDEARNHGCALHVDDLRFGTRITRHLRVRSAGDDTAVVDGERLDDAEVRVDGQDLAVRDYRVDLLLSKCRGAGECGEYTASDAHAEFDFGDTHTARNPRVAVGIISRIP